ncbi:MAG: hypothetical protein M3N39_04105 [Pseudomonadota bacterium]|nr:hypothetical protein [Pseudomonadota bacterium]
MAEPKPFASLSSGLLARKGAAKPAMRPQGFGQMGMGLEDLGWNDMGHSHQAPTNSYEPHEPAALPEHVPSSISALTPAPRQSPQPRAAEDEVPPQPATEPAPPPVIEQQRAVEAAFAEPEQHHAPEPPEAPRSERPQQARVSRPRTPAGRQRSAPGDKAKAAFTLRLDPDRHLKLRLACAVTHRSAQQIVTEALDEFLGSIPGIDAIASQVPGPSAKAN